MESREISLVVTEEMFAIISRALLDNLLEAEKVADHAVGCEFAIINAANAALMYHSFVQSFS